MGLICAIRYHAAIPKVMEKLTNFNIQISTYFKILLFYLVVLYFLEVTRLRNNILLLKRPETSMKTNSCIIKHCVC